MSEIDRIALERIESGDVKLTSHGWRVQCRPDLNDFRMRAEAYWPKWDGDREKWVCLCWAASTHGKCSHVRAVEILLERGEPFPRPQSQANRPPRGWKPPKPKPIPYAKSLAELLEKAQEKQNDETNTN